MNYVLILLGVVLLLFGRRLFWFFVAAAGFAVGMIIARDSLELDSDWMVFAIALLAGLIGALVAFFLQKLAIALAGFAGGGYLGAVLMGALEVGQYAWIGFLVGGIIGAILLLTIFEWALIGISALLGAALVADAIADKSTAFLVFLTCLIIGIVAQALQYRRVRRVERAPTRRVEAR